MKETYEAAIRKAAKYGISDLSNYLLYNFEDEPEELYYRMKINVDLCDELGVTIYSFPMKYHPIDDPDYSQNRDYIGKHWNRKFIRTVQAVLNSTKGKIGRGKSFFKEERILEKSTLLGTFERTHVSAYSSSVTWKNCLFVGDQGCFLDPFLGLGAATAIVSGVMAARSIIENTSYDKLVQEHKKVISVMGKIRNLYDNIDDQAFDALVACEDNSIVKKLIYGTNIDWLKYGSFTLGSFVKQKKSPNLHDTTSSPTDTK
jgi:hypothetical protein